MKLANVLVDIKKAFELEAKPLPKAIFFSTDLTEPLKQSLDAYGVSEEEAAKIQKRGYRCFDMRIMVAEPVPHDQVWLFDQAGNRVGVFQLGEKNDSAHSI